MTDPTITDLRRELEKAHAALTAARTHLARHAEANAALHCAERVMYSPLHAKVDAALTGIDHALNRTSPAVTVTEWATEHSDRHCPWRTLLADLDRCQHGRHHGDACGPAGDCNGTSAGNLWLQPGMVIGHGLRGDEIVVPGRDEKHDPANWRRKGGR